MPTEVYVITNEDGGVIGVFDGLDAIKDFYDELESCENMSDEDYILLLLAESDIWLTKMPLITTVKRSLDPSVKTQPIPML